MVRFVLKRPVFTTVVFLLFIAMSFFAFFNISVDLLPQISGPSLIVTTSWPYHSPQTIESKLTVPIEEIAWKLRGVKKTISHSSYGQSVVEIEFNKNVNVRFNRFLLKEEIVSIRKKLPFNVSGPYITKNVPREISNREKQFFQFQLIAPYNVQRLREFCKKSIVPQIAAIYGVSNVYVYGGSMPVVKVVLNRERMKSLNIPLFQVTDAITTLNIPPKSLLIEKDDRITQIIVGDNEVSIGDLNNLPVVKKGKKIVYLKDIASVFKGYGMLNSLARVNGMDALTITVNKNKDANAIKLSNKIRKTLEKLELRYGFLKYKILEDSGNEIKKRVKSLLVKVGYILLFVFLSLVIFLFSIRLPVIAMLSILFSALITIDLFFLFKISINLVSLTGLALGFGMMVDNSIVVGESIMDKLLEGKDRQTAIVEGSNEVFGSVLASTLTTIGGFFAFAFISGRLADYYLPMVYAVVISLLSSLFIAFSLIPLLFAYTGVGSKKRFVIRFSFLRKPLRFIAKSSIITVLIFVYIFNYSFNQFRENVETGKFGWNFQNNKLYVSIRMPGETDVSTVVDILTPVEREILKSKAVKEEVLTVYKKGGYITVSFKKEYEDSFLPLVLKHRIIALVSPLAGITVSVSGIDDKSYYSSPGGIPSFFSSHIIISGYSFEKVKKIAEHVKNIALKNSRRVRKALISFDKRYWFRGDRKEFVIEFNKEFISRHGIKLTNLISFLAANLNTEYRLNVKHNGNSIGLTVRYENSKAFTKDRLYNLIYMGDNGIFKLKQLISVKTKSIGTAIEKENQKYTADVMWNYIGSERGSERYLKKVFNRIKLPAGYTKSIGQSFLTKKEKKMIYKGYIIAIGVIFLILAAYFESFFYPLIVMLALPFSLVGVFFIFLKGGFSFDSAAYVGLILVFGIVVNNAILFVDYYRRFAKENVELASIKRARPMILTTLTTVAGMIPLLLKENNFNNQTVWQLLGITTIGGLISSTLFIIIFMPAFVVVFKWLKTGLIYLFSYIKSGFFSVFNFE